MPNFSSLEFTHYFLHSPKSNVTTLELNVTTLESNVTTLESNVTTLESNVTTLESNVTTLELNVTSLELNVTSLERFEATRSWLSATTELDTKHKPESLRVNLTTEPPNSCG
jgi:hypothetical protein